MFLDLIKLNVLLILVYVLRFDLNHFLYFKQHFYLFI